MSGKIQDQDIKSQAELISAGGVKASLPNDTKVYISAYSAGLTLAELITQYKVGDGDSPLRMAPSSPADAKLNFNSSQVSSLDGTVRNAPPVGGTVPAVLTAGYIDFQAKTTSGSSFTITFPGSSTLNFFRLAGFTQTSDGKITVIFSTEAASVGALPNPITVLTAGGSPIGYIILKATSITGQYKTSGSTTSIIEAAPGGIPAIIRFSSMSSASSGGSGGSLLWVEDGASAPSTIEFSNLVYLYPSGGSNHLYSWVKVPSSYTAGAPIKMRLPWYSPDSSGNGLMSTVATLIRSGTDAANSTTNQRTSTNTAITLSGGTVNVPQVVTYDLTDTTGNINGVAVSPNDLIRVDLIRGSDTATSDIRNLVNSGEVTFQ